MQLLLLLFTRFLTSLLLGNPISRANPVQSGQGLCTNARTFSGVWGSRNPYSLGPIEPARTQRTGTLGTTSCRQRPFPETQRSSCIDLPRSRFLRPLLELDQSV